MNGMHVLGRLAVGLGFAATLSMGAALAPAHADSNLYTDRNDLSPDGREAGIGPLGSIATIFFAPIIAGVTIGAVADGLGGWPGGSEAMDSFGSFAGAMVLPLLFGAMVGGVTCLVGFVADDGQGDCGLVVFSTTITTATFVGLASGTDTSGALFSAILFPSVVGLFVYNVTADGAFTPTIIVPTRQAPPTGPAIFPVLRMDF